MPQIKTKLSERRARRTREIVERYPCSSSDAPHKLEMAKTRNGKLLMLYDDEIVATRGGLCWITQKEAIAVFDEADLNSMWAVDPATLPDGTPYSCRHRMPERRI